MERVVRSNKRAEVGQCDKSKREANISRECGPKGAGVCFQSRSRGRILEVRRKEAAHRIAPRRPEEIKTSDFKIRGRGTLYRWEPPTKLFDASSGLRYRSLRWPLRGSQNDTGGMFWCEWYSMFSSHFAREGFPANSSPPSVVFGSYGTEPDDALSNESRQVVAVIVIIHVAPSWSSSTGGSHSQRDRSAVNQSWNEGLDCLPKQPQRQRSCWQGHGHPQDRMRMLKMHFSYFCRELEGPRPKCGHSPNHTLLLTESAWLESYDIQTHYCRIRTNPARLERQGTSEAEEVQERAMQKREDGAASPMSAFDALRMLQAPEHSPRHPVSCKLQHSVGGKLRNSQDIGRRADPPHLVGGTAVVNALTCSSHSWLLFQEPTVSILVLFWKSFVHKSSAYQTMIPTHSCYPYIGNMSSPLCQRVSLLWLADIAETGERTRNQSETSKLDFDPTFICRLSGPESIPTPVVQDITGLHVWDVIGAGATVKRFRPRKEGETGAGPSPSCHDTLFSPQTRSLHKHELVETTCSYGHSLAKRTAQLRSSYAYEPFSKLRPRRPLILRPPNSPASLGPLIGPLVGVSWFPAHASPSDALPPQGLGTITHELDVLLLLRTVSQKESSCPFVQILGVPSQERPGGRTPKWYKTLQTVHIYITPSEDTCYTKEWKTNPELDCFTAHLEIQFSSANDPASSVDRSKAQKPKIGPSSGSNFPYRVSTVDQPSISRVEGRKNRTLVRRRAALNATPVAYAIVREGKSPVRRFIVKQIMYSIGPTLILHLPLFQILLPKTICRRPHGQRTPVVPPSSQKPQPTGPSVTASPYVAYQPPRSQNLRQMFLRVFWRPPHPEEPEEEVPEVMAIVSHAPLRRPSVSFARPPSPMTRTGGIGSEVPTWEEEGIDTTQTTLWPLTYAVSGSCYSPF
ncbi:uncharacterized protein CLUP02_00187 [Colletotrichum lupini]|uniref:Uncharacterized protein n=1 Tax=Colletotrichum lupini TaxID=145971 RepID=A0A9Q8S9F3_9PEZI|nr:uncharacterized protein CLUP02_00187 [Colletotrichum lupini]UQC73542.1 hypothetical protein CLUP02_00187 [Colletotrichum lupini]